MLRFTDYGTPNAKRLLDHKIDLKMLNKVNFLVVIVISLICGLSTQAVIPTTAQVTLAWDASPDSQVTGYTVSMGNASGTYSNSFDAGNALTFRVSGLIPSVTYYFVVKAYDANGNESDPSNEISYTAPTPAPAPMPKTYVSTNTTDGSIGTFTMPTTKTPVITLNTVPGNTYNVWATSTLSTWELVGSITADSATAQIEDLAAVTNACRFYRVELIVNAAILAGK